MPVTEATVLGSFKTKIPITAAPMGSPSVSVEAIRVGVCLKPINSSVKAKAEFTTPSIPTQSRPLGVII